MRKLGSFTAAAASGTATVYEPDSKPFDMIGWILLYGRALALYL
jgi:hypothetical protein